MRPPGSASVQRLLPEVSPGARANRAAGSLRPHGLASPLSHGPVILKKKGSIDGAITTVPATLKSCWVVKLALRW